MLNVLVVEQLHDNSQHCGGLIGDPGCVLRFREPLTQPAGHLCITHLGLDHIGREEVLPHEGPEPFTQLVLLALDDGRVRDLEPEWVAEQRGDGKPVGQGADHPGFSGRPDIPEPTGAATGLTPSAGQEDHGRAEQKTQGHGLHLAQIAGPLGVRPGVRPGQGLHEAMFSSHATIIHVPVDSS